MLFTFPSRYLFTIGHARVLRLGGWSPHVQTGFHVSRPTRIRLSFLPVRGYHPLMPNFPDGSSSKNNRHWPGPRSLATTNGVSVDVLSSGYLDVSVPQVCFLHLCIQCKMTLRPGFPIRKSMDQSLLTAPHSLSQRATSFIASQCQGIHQMPLRHLIVLITTMRQLPCSRGTCVYGICFAIS